MQNIKENCSLYKNNFFRLVRLHHFLLINLAVREMAGPVADAGDVRAPHRARALAADHVAALEARRRAAASAVVAEDVDDKVFPVRVKGSRIKQNKTNNKQNN